MEVRFTDDFYDGKIEDIEKLSFVDRVRHIESGEPINIHNYHNYKRLEELLGGLYERYPLQILRLIKFEENYMSGEWNKLLDEKYNIPAFKARIMSANYHFDVVNETLNIIEGSDEKRDNELVKFFTFTINKKFEEDDGYFIFDESRFVTDVILEGLPYESIKEMVIDLYKPYLMSMKITISFKDDEGE